MTQSQIVDRGGQGVSDTSDKTYYVNKEMQFARPPLESVAFTPI